MAKLLAPIVVVLAVCAPATSAAARAPLARVEADPAVKGPAVARSFLGYSIEVQQLEPFAGPAGVPVNPVTLQLTRNLAAFGGGAPMLRVGGGSTDLSYPAASAQAARPKGMVHAITPGYLSLLTRYLTASRSKLLFGINFGLDQPSLAATLAQEVMSVVPRKQVAGLELGNEPDTYPLFDLFPGHPIRPKSFGPSDYVRQALAHDRAIARLAPGAPMAGPSTIGGYAAWIKAFPRILSAQRRYLKLVTIHSYPLLACASGGGHRKVSPWALLGRGALEGRAGLFAGLIRMAAHIHRRVRVSETNSIACGGSHGASDAFASALWGADWAFLVAALHGAGVNFHFASPAYSPFTAGYTKDGALARVHPLYYGMLLFAAATPHGARILPDSFRRVRLRGRANVHVWATYDHVDRVVRVAVIDKDRSASGSVAVHVPHARGRGTLERLLAPSVTSTTGVTWAGQSFADPTSDGRLQGRRVIHRVARRRGDRFVFSMPAHSAALLTVPARGG